MGTINEKINYLNQTKSLIKEAIINKGVEVSENDTFRSYADKISNIKNGGTGEDIDFEEITITPTTEIQVKEGAFNKVTVEAIKLNLQEKTVTPTTEQQEIIADEEYDGLEKVTVEPIAENNLEIIPSSENQNFNGVYTNVSVVGDENLVPDNIKKGTSIFGVEGNASSANFKITSGYYLFYNGHRTDYVQEILNLCEKITSASYMFSSCEDLTELDVSNLDTSEVTNMSYMFNRCNKVQNLDVSKFNTSKVTNMSYMFAYLDYIEELDVSNFDTSKVTNMSYMFYSFGFHSQAGTLDISNFDMSKVTNANSFLRAQYLKNFKFGTNLGKGYTQKTNNYSNYKLDLAINKELTHDSLMSIINNLYDLNLTYDVANGGTLYTQSLTLGSTNKNKLTPEEIAIVTAKGWSVS